MKNLLVGALSVLLIIGCEKQDVVPTVDEANSELGVLESLKQNVHVKNEMLVFKDEASYKDAINYLVGLESEEKDYASYWDNAIGFNSLNQQKTAEELNAMGMYDAVFAELLNANQEIQIGTKVFKINTADAVMTVRDVNRQRAETLSTADSYFDIQDGLTTSGARGACAKESEPSTRWGAGSVGQVTSEVSYQRGGIYFSLVAKVKQSSRPNGRTISLFSGGGNTYTKNKSGASAETIATKSKNGGSGSYSYRPYFNTRQLKQFYFEVDFAYNYIGVGSDLWTTIISCS